MNLLGLATFVFISTNDAVAFVPPVVYRLKYTTSAASRRLSLKDGSAFAFGLFSDEASQRRRFRLGPMYLSEEDDDDDDDIDLSDQDWRAFRAKLVMKKPEKEEDSQSISSATVVENEDDVDGIGALFQSSSVSGMSGDDASTTSTMSSDAFTPLDPSQWAYDSGKVIEQGAVILGGVEQDFGFGLRQQYFHKAAILVLDHDENQFTKGIILNRPSDQMLDDDLNNIKWRVWFGGDVQGIDHIVPEIVCLHSLKGEQASKASVQVMKDVKWTTFENAKKLVKAGVAKPSDFWVFAGYAGWGPGQLMGELDRKSWYMVATDSQTLLKELAKQSAGADPRDAGLDTWELLMNMIGRGDTAEESSGDFDDLMLKEWAREHLLSVEEGGGVGAKLGVTKLGGSTKDVMKASAADRGMDVAEGSVVRGSSAERSPFLLKKQELHKSIILIIIDDENISVGVILNHPAAKGIDMQIMDKVTRETRTVTIPLRYGGEYAVKGQHPLLWLHCNPRLRTSQVGSEVGPSKEAIWKCSQDEATAAIGQGVAKPEDFLVVSGVSVWTKGEGGTARGIQGEVSSGNFEVIPSSQIQSVWDTLLKQEVLTALNLSKNLAIGNEAWLAGACKRSASSSGEVDIVDGIGEGYDEEDDSLVFKSDAKVSELSDDALRSWIATFLLGAPRLG